MALINKRILIFGFLFSISSPSWGLFDTKLPALITKQAIFNLRFVSRDGELTYYQRKSGDLILATNFRILKLIKGEKNANYNIYSSPERKMLLFSKDDSYHKIYGIRRIQDIYYSKFGEEHPPKHIGRGTLPQLHLKDEWASFYDPFSRVLKFVKLANPVINFSIALRNEINPYFFPAVLMLSKDLILFTDLNSKGFPGVLAYKRIRKKISALYRGESPTEKLELCLKKDNIIFGRFGFDGSSLGSQIYSIPMEKISFEKRKAIYSSKLNDPGNMECNNAPKYIYFIKNLTVKNGKESYEVASLKLGRNRLRVISDVKFATQVVNMDGRLLVPYRGKYFVLKGEKSLKSDNFIK